MMRFFAGEFADALDELHTQMADAEQAARLHGDVALGAGQLKSLTGAIEAMRKHCDAVSLPISVDRIIRFYRLLVGFAPTPCTQRMVHHEIKALIESIAHELGDRTFVCIPPDRVCCLEQDKLFGEAVSRALPSAESDLQAAGNCIATDLNTAAVFHLMCVVEHALRSLAKHLKVRSVRKNVPIELGTWEQIIQALEAKTQKSPQKNPSRKRQQDRDFYKELLIEFRAVKDVWRNKIMHARVRYSYDEANIVFHHVRQFTQRLAERISPK